MFSFINLGCYSLKLIVFVNIMLIRFSVFSLQNWFGFSHFATLCWGSYRNCLPRSPSPSLHVYIFYLVKLFFFFIALNSCLLVKWFIFRLVLFPFVLNKHQENEHVNKLKCFFPSTSRLWNSLPSVFPASFNLPSFKRQVYHHLRDQMAFFLLPFFRYFVLFFHM